MNLVIKDWHIALKNKSIKGRLKENEDIEAILKSIGYFKNKIEEFQNLNSKSVGEYLNIVSSIYDIDMDIKSLAENLLETEEVKTYCLKAGIRRSAINTESSNLAHIGLKNYVEVETMDIIAYAKIPKREFTKEEIEEEIKNKNIILTYSKPYYLPIRSDIWYLNLENENVETWEDLCLDIKNYGDYSKYQEMLFASFNKVLNSKKVAKDLKKLQRIFGREVTKAKNVIMLQMKKEMEEFSLYKKEKQEELKLEEKGLVAYQKNVLEILDSN